MSNPTSPQEAFENTQIEFSLDVGDDGIGGYEHGSYYGFDSQPYVSSSCAGTVTLTWTQDDETAPTEFTVSMDGGEDIDVDVTVTPEGEPLFVTTEEGVQVTQIFTYEGEGSREGGCMEPDYDGPEDDEPYVSDADYGRMEDAYFGEY